MQTIIKNHYKPSLFSITLNINIRHCLTSVKGMNAPFLAVFYDHLPVSTINQSTYDIIMPIHQELTNNDTVR